MVKEEPRFKLHKNVNIPKGGVTVNPVDGEGHTFFDREDEVAGERWALWEGSLLQRVRRVRRPIVKAGTARKLVDETASQSTPEPPEPETALDMPNEPEAAPEPVVEPKRAESKPAAEPKSISKTKVEPPTKIETPVGAVTVHRDAGEDGVLGTDDDKVTIKKTTKGTTGAAAKAKLAKKAPKKTPEKTSKKSAEKTTKKAPKKATAKTKKTAGNKTAKKETDKPKPKRVRRKKAATK